MTKRAALPQKRAHLRLVGGASPAPLVTSLAYDDPINFEPIEERVSPSRVADATARINEGDAMSSEMVRLVELYSRIDEGAARDLVRSLVSLIVNAEESRDPNGAVSRDSNGTVVH